MYAALSYCWGNRGLPLKTEKHSLHERLSGILIESLPLCFQDAVKLARSLGLRYLWIDALCIVQVDIRDWETQAASMFDIFSKAALTIAVAPVSSCQESFLAKPIPQQFHIPFRSTKHPGVSGVFSIHKVPPKWDPTNTNVVNLRPCDGGLFASKWCRRGWMWQERNMAPRLLIWGEYMFHLQDSRGDVVSEDMTTALKPNVCHDLVTWRCDVERLWYIWVWQYSLTKLTYASDRLPAISGLARRAAQDVAAPYRAGHWQTPRFCLSLF